MASKSNLSVVIDIGTSKIVGIAGLLNEDRKIEIAGLASVASKGLKRGLVFKIDDVVSSVQKLLAILEKQIEEKITNVSIAYAGQQLKWLDYKGERETASDQVVTESMLSELKNEALNLKIDPNYRILHVIPQSFVIDEEISELNPVGIIGANLVAKFKLLVVPEIQIQNLYKVFERLNVEIDKITYSPLAISEAVLTSAEKEVGSIVLDIGEGTTKVAVYHDNVLLRVAVIPFGGGVVNKDIKEGCSILLEWAEKLKVKYGHALGDFAEEQKVVTIPGYSGWEPKEISFKSLAFIIQARLEEIMDSVNYQIEKSGIENVGSGVIITGGTSNLKNIVALVKFRTGCDARLAFPIINTVNKKEEFQSDKYLTALGLLKLTLHKETPVKKPVKVKWTWGEKLNGITPKLKDVFQGVINFVDESDELK